MDSVSCVLYVIIVCCMCVFLFPVYTSWKHKRKYNKTVADFVAMDKEKEDVADNCGMDKEKEDVADNCGMDTGDLVYYDFSVPVSLHSDVVEWYPEPKKKSKGKKDKKSKKSKGKKKR